MGDSNNDGVIELVAEKYLWEKTHGNWKVEAEREHLDMQLKCHYRDWTCCTRNIDISMWQVKGIGLNGIFKIHLDEVIIAWERYFND